MGALDDFDFPSYFLGLCSTFSTLEIQEGDDDERPKHLKIAEKETITCKGGVMNFSCPGLLKTYI